MSEPKAVIVDDARVNIEFDLAKFVQHYYGDDDMARDNIQRQAAEMLLKDIRADIRAALQAQIAEQVGEVIRETIAAGVQKTNTWGEPTGGTTTLRDTIAKEVNDYLTKETGDYNRRETRVHKFMREVVDREIQKELKGAVDQAKAEVIARVKAQAAEVIAETVARMGGVR